MKWVEIWRSAPAEAEVLAGLLQAQGIPVERLQEGAGRAMGLIYGPLGNVVLLVPQQHAEAARALCRRFASGDFPTGEPDQ